jgi:hypothetical protein
LLGYSIPAAGFNCARSFCGCWTPVALNFNTVAVDKDQTPIKGVQLLCSKEQEPIGTSDKDGNIRFIIETMQSPGCHFQRCTNLRFNDPSGVYEDLETTIYVANGKSVILKKRSSD